jgi:hypothetical protein
VPSDRPFRISFPRPIVMHGNDRRDLTERVLEYLRQPDKLTFEPLGPEEAQPR